MIKGATFGPSGQPGNGTKLNLADDLRANVFFFEVVVIAAGVVVVVAGCEVLASGAAAVLVHGAAAVVVVIHDDQVVVPAIVAKGAETESIKTSIESCLRSPVASNSLKQAQLSSLISLTRSKLIIQK